jgi:hypothetical protein
MTLNDGDSEGGYQLAPRPWVQDGEALVVWLRAQFDDDERIARACGDVPWVDDVPGMVHVDPAAIRGNKWAFGHLGYVVSADPSDLGNAYRAHIAAHDPARVLREVAARRRILNECLKEIERENATGRRYPASTAWALAVTTIRLLALPYADRPGYRAEKWKP